MNSTVPGSMFPVPGSGSKFGFRVRGSGFMVRRNVERAIQNLEREPEHEPGTRNPERGTARL